MTIWDWVRSAVIFLAAVFIFNNFFISLTILEAVILTLFLGVCVFHIVDIREELLVVYARRKVKKENNNGNGGSSGPLQGPEDPELHR